ncbi:MAG: MarR family transcriptional regulator [Flavobacteriales bacterium]|nr:MarR family transcriptional regulator [Flavobacteriales bacterium]
MPTKFEEAIRQQKFGSPTQKALLNVQYTANWFRDLQRGVFKELPIEPQHFNVLRILKGRHPHPVCPGDIKAVMLDKAPDVTRLVDKLVDLGWVVREVGAGDRRRVDIGLTAKGLEHVDRISTQVKSQAKVFHHRLTEAEAEQLSHLLDKLRG